MTEPLVTVGIPTLNRPDGLKRTLASICAQTYRNLEIIVSDNASSDLHIRDVVSSFMARDDRISYRRHPVNIGSNANFSSLISRSQGEFFMLAADDDRWEPFFVKTCVDALLADHSLAVCQMEAQYETKEGLFPPFFEGIPFHNHSSEQPIERVKHLLRHVYGNLVYGVFRREALFHNGRPVTEWIGRTLNEIPMLILVSSWGNIRVIPKIGMFKSAPKNVCEQARWEQVGGRLPNWAGWRKHLSDCRALHQYHAMVRRENFAAIREIGKITILAPYSAFYLLRHQLFLAVRRKPALTKSCNSLDEALEAIARGWAGTPMK